MRSASLGAGARMPPRPPGCSTPTLDSKRPGAAVLRDGRVGRHGAQEPEGLGGHRWTRWCGGGALHAAAAVVAAAPPTEPAPPRVVPQREAVRADCFPHLPPTFERGVSAASFTLGFVGSSLVAFLCEPSTSRRSFPLNNRKFCPNFKSPKTLFWRTVPLGQRVGRRVHSRAALGGHQRRRAERTRSLCACDSCASSSPSWPRSTVTPPRASAVAAMGGGGAVRCSGRVAAAVRGGRRRRGALLWPRSGSGGGAERCFGGDGGAERGGRAAAARSAALAA